MCHARRQAQLQHVQLHERPRRAGNPMRETLSHDADAPHVSGEKDSTITCRR